MAYGESNIVPYLFDRLVLEQDLHAAPELIALAVNLALERRAAEQLVTPPQRLAQLLSAAAERKEPLLLKVLRNAAQALAGGPPAAKELVGSRFGPHVPTLLALAREAEGDADMLVELLGTLSVVAEADPQSVLSAALSADMVRFLAAHLAPGAVDDDVMLEARKRDHSIIHSFFRFRVRSSLGWLYPGVTCGGGKTTVAPSHSLTHAAPSLLLLLLLHTASGGDASRRPGLRGVRGRPRRRGRPRPPLRPHVSAKRRRRIRFADHLDVLPPSPRSRDAHGAPPGHAGGHLPRRSAAG